MKLTPLLAAATLAFAAVMPAAANSITYTADLSGLNEIPDNTSAGTGLAIITLDDHAMTMRVQADFANLTGNVTSAHIHCCTTVPAFGTSGVATTTPTFAGFPAGVTSGTYDQTLDMSLASSWNGAFINTHGGTIETAFSALAQGLADQKAYFNIHSTAFASGEIRGTLTAVPEPGTYALMLVGLVGIAALGHRRQA
jgi:hypothetical protein